MASQATEERVEELNRLHCFAPQNNQHLLELLSHPHRRHHLSLRSSFRRSDSTLWFVVAVSSSVLVLDTCRHGPVGETPYKGENTNERRSPNGNIPSRIDSSKIYK